MYHNKSLNNMERYGLLSFFLERVDLGAWIALVPFLLLDSDEIKWNPSTSHSCVHSFLKF